MSKYIAGITVNPKLKEPVVVVLDDDGDVQVFRMRPAPAEKHGRLTLVERTGNWGMPPAGFTYEGYGEITDDDELAEATQWLRVHTPGGVVTRNEGFGTTLYCGAATCAHLIHERDLTIDVGQYGAGSGVVSNPQDRSPAASSWWRNAVALDLAESLSLDDERENEDLDLDASDLSACFDDEDREITHVNHLNADVVYRVPYNALEFESVWRSELCVAVTNLEVPYDKEVTEPTPAIRSAFDDYVIDADADAILALDVSDVSELGIFMLVDILRNVEASKEDIRLMLLRWQHRLDPDETDPRQQTLPFKANSSEARAMREAFARTELRRREMDWNKFASLP